MHKWKKAFLWLAGVNLGIILLFIVMLTWLLVVPDNKTSSKNIGKLTATDPIFTVSSNKEQLTKLINQEIDKHPTGNLDFHVEMTDTINIVGNLQVFFAKIPFEIRFAPKVSDGDIQLKEESAKIGAFSLPESQVLKFIRAGGDLPDWVEILPNEKQINVKLSEYLIKDRYYFKAENIDLAKDNIMFRVYQASKKK